MQSRTAHEKAPGAATRPDLTLLWSFKLARCVTGSSRPSITNRRRRRHVTTGPDNTNNVMALVFGVLIVVLVVVGSLLIMAALNDNMKPASPFTYGSVSGSEDFFFETK